MISTPARETVYVVSWGDERYRSHPCYSPYVGVFASHEKADAYKGDGTLLSISEHPATANGAVADEAVNRLCRARHAENIGMPMKEGDL